MDKVPHLASPLLFLEAKGESKTFSRHGACSITTTHLGHPSSTYLPLVELPSPQGAGWSALPIARAGAGTE